MNKHTPGPWRISAAIKPNEFDIRDKNSSGGHAPIAKVKGDKRHTIAQSAANARLIAAAPDLLQACWAMVTSFHAVEYMAPHMQEAANMARAAIAKAEAQ